jgi:hypothetical protein
MNPTPAADVRFLRRILIGLGMLTLATGAGTHLSLLMM